jgi:hypothetical protein
MVHEEIFTDPFSVYSAKKVMSTDKEIQGGEGKGKKTGGKGVFCIF